MGHILKIMVLSCAAIAVFLWLQACDQASSPVGRQDRDHSAEQPKQADSAPAPQATTPTSTSAGASASTSASADSPSKPTEEQIAESEVTCRLANYVAYKDLTVQQARSLSESASRRADRKMRADSSLSVGRAKNAALDDLGIPRYPECNIGG